MSILPPNVSITKTLEQYFGVRAEKDYASASISLYRIDDGSHVATIPADELIGKDSTETLKLIESYLP